MANPSSDVPRSERLPALTFRQGIGLAFGAAALLIAATGLISFSELRKSVAGDRAILHQARDVIEFDRLRATIEKRSSPPGGFSSAAMKNTCPRSNDGTPI